MLKLFSADDHVIEHPRVWLDRLPRRLHEVAPHIVEDKDGRQYWEYEDRRGQSPGQMGASVRLREKTRSNESMPRPYRYDEMLPGCYDPAERARDMISNGVLASVCFPSLPRFAGVLFSQFKDKALAQLCVEAYNDYIIDEWCPAGPEGMYVPLMIAPLWDPAAGAKEIERCASRGFRAISMPENTVPIGLPSYYTDHWDPIWAACEEAGITVCTHIGTSGQTPDPSPDASEFMRKTLEAALITGVGAQVALVNLIFSPVCRKFPGLRFIFSESGIGWTPYVIERADMVWERYRDVYELGDIKPSEIWERNMYLCQVEERLGLGAIPFLGAHKVLWELDYPHPDTVWPHAQQAAQSVFDEASLSDDVVEMITWRNASQLFGWKPASESQLLSSNESQSM